MYTVLIYHEIQSDIIQNGRKVMTVTTLRVIITDVIYICSQHRIIRPFNYSPALNIGSWGINIPWNIKQHTIYLLPLNTVIMFFSVVEINYNKKANSSQKAQRRYITFIKQNSFFTV